MLSKENINKLIFGGLYEIDYEDLKKWCPNQCESLNDQHYRIWVPVKSQKNNGEINYYMIDTYQIDGGIYHNRYSNDKEERMNGLIEGLESLENKNGNWVSRMPYNYFYSAIIKITDENFEIFKLFADLHEYKLSDEKKCRDYNEEDTLQCIQLYNEHAYPTGVFFVKKDAKYNYQNKIEAKIYDINKWISCPQPASDYEIKELLDIEKEAQKLKAEYNKKEFDKFIKRNEFIKKLKDLYDKYYNEL